jgi:hypothetical protein
MTPEQMLDLPVGARARYLGGDYDGFISVGTILTRYKAPSDDEDSVGFTYDEEGNYEYFEPHEIEFIVEETPPCGTEVLGVFRPELETRKVGKIRVELVDDGFPLALREVAKVMTWAQTAKGYKDHDWQNLPNAEVSLAAAASRHRTDHIEQRVVNRLAISECVDIESSLLHKAHEAFGVLAQLELMCRGKFQ